MDRLPDWLQQLMGMSAEEAGRAIAELAAEKTPEAAERLRLVEEAGSPALRKEARRALYRLRAAGVEVPPPRPVRVETGPTRSLMSWVDGAGHIMMVCLVDRPSGGARLVQVVIGDEGLLAAQVTEMSPRQLARALREVEAEVRAVECPVPYARHRIAQAAGRGMPDDPAERGMAEAAVRTVGTPPGEVAHPVYGVLDPLAVKWDPDLLPQTPRLLETEEMGGWVLPREQVSPWAGRYDQISSSPLVVDAATERARRRELVREAVRELFPAGSIPSWRRRLEDMAYYFHRRGEERNARLALRAAIALDPAQAPDEHPLLLALVEKSLVLARPEQEEQGEQRRIIVPGR